MRINLNWLKDFVNIDLSPNELSDLLTMNSLEVETIEPQGQGLRNIVAARILDIRPHPNADRLSLCVVDTGDREVPVVCGAPNLEVGMLSPIALPGIKLPNGMVMEATRIRGQESVGMLLAEDEMGLTDDHTGIVVLPSETKPGTPIPSVMPVEDWVLEIGITPNRPDCTSVLGVAREIAALTGQKLRQPVIEIVEDQTPIGDLAGVMVEDPVGCPRYAAGMVREVELKASPFWMRYRLHLCGMRGISNVVDITNYVLFEMGQPLHAFDYDRLQENRIVVRRARKGEPFTTLDGKTHSLSLDHLMICDGRRSVALAGIMGGLNSEIFAGTRNVLIESAYFDPITIRRGSKQLNLLTEASYRFERGIDMENVTTALKRALYLMARYAGGKIARGIIDHYPEPYQPKTIDLRIDKTNALLGLELDRDRVAGYLEALELGVETCDQNTLRVRPPAFRVDLVREVDIMEEVARLEGYERIPVTSPHVRPYVENESPVLFMSDGPREIMAGMGFEEILSYSFMSPESVDVLGVEQSSELRSFVRLLNPLTVDQSVMRTSLVPGLLGTIKTNIAHGEEDLRVFEWGNVFIRQEGEELPLEKPLLAAIMTGHHASKAWYREKRNLDFYDIKGVLEALMKGLRIKDVIFKRGEMPAYYHPEVSAVLESEGSVIGRVGQVAAEVIERLEIKSDAVYVFELEMPRLLGRIQSVPVFEPFSKFPAVYRDISLLIDKRVESAVIRGIIKDEGKELVESAELYDVFEGGKIDALERAMTFRICYRSSESTLDGRKVNSLHESIINEIQKKTGGRLREA